ITATFTIGVNASLGPQAVTVTTSGGTSNSVSFTVNPSVLVMNCTPTSGPLQVAISYSATCTATGGSSPYNWAVNPGPLPTGLILSSSGSGATVSGTPTASGDYSYAV